MKILDACGGIVGAAVLLVAASFVAADPLPRTTGYHEQIAALRGDTRATRVVEELGVNTEVAFRLVSPDKCEKEGEFELHRLASNAGVEESYVLIPELCLWIEVGFAETRKKVRLDTKFINELLKQFREVHFYHIHAGDFPDFENYFPAYKDLITLTLINSQFVWNDLFKIKHFLITRYGIIEYKLTDKQKVTYLIDYYKKSGLRGFESQNLAYEYLRFKYKLQYYAKIEECKSSSESIPVKIMNCFPIVTDAFTLTFRSIRPILN